MCIDVHVLLLHYGDVNSVNLLIQSNPLYAVILVYPKAI